MAKVNSTAGIQLGFFSSALKDDEIGLRLLGARGTEALSRHFEFDLLLERPGTPLTEEQRFGLVNDPCVIALGTHYGDVVHGVLTSLTYVDGAREESTYYRATLVPVTAMLDLGRRSAIYQNTTVPEMIAAVLSSYGMSKGKSFDIRITEEAKSPKHEYIVQYRESDWAFLSRWMEREGYFYWFVHNEKGAKLVIADANADTTAIEDPEVISYRERNNLTTNGLATIWDFRQETRRVPAKVTLVDYNHRRPKEMLIASETVEKRGFGHVFHYGDHFKDGNVAAAWTKIRAQEHLVDQVTIRGRTDCARFRVGHTFVLENHFVADHDGSYLITGMQHEVGIDPAFMDSGDFTSGTLQAPAGYSARFTAIPLGVQFRPHRVTPWPRIDGIINAHIDADTTGDFAQIDDTGRYKVKLPFDLGPTKGLSSSRWIRMAQAYAGTGYGAHSPQHKGAEVILAHIDGDPDRPVIIGAIPNAITPGTVFDKNATQSVVQTASGIRVELEDQA